MVSHIAPPSGAPAGTHDLSAGLYPRLLAAEWGNLDPAVQGLHAHGAAGAIEIRHGSTRLARLLLRIMRMPPTAPAVWTRLDILHCHGGERWVRWFGDHVVATLQREQTGRLLAERFGALEFYFRLRVADGALHYEQTGTALCLGPWRVPLPRRMAPRVSAQEAPTGRDRTHVLVSVTMPMAGFLISYEGGMELQAPGSR